ncbi:MAG: hypothetical protein P8Y91_10925, partial [Desulfuromonadales bacterium]
SGSSTTSYPGGTDAAGDLLMGYALIQIDPFLLPLAVLVRERQQEAGKTFVSRTRLQVSAYDRPITVLRVVLANPLTTDEILTSVLQEQCTIVLQQDIQALLSQVEKICALIDEPPVACSL